MICKFKDCKNENSPYNPFFCDDHFSQPPTQDTGIEKELNSNCACTSLMDAVKGKEVVKCELHASTQDTDWEKICVNCYKRVENLLQAQRDELVAKLKAKRIFNRTQA